MPENAFVSLPEVAQRLRLFGVEHVPGGFLVPAGNADGLRLVLQELQSESVRMAFGGEDRITILKEAVRPPRWWRLARSVAPIPHIPLKP